MTSTSRTRRAATAAAWVAAGALGATTITGLAFASGSPTAAPADAPAAIVAPVAGDAAPSTKARGARMLRNVLHGRLTVSTRTGTRTVDVQRGKVTASSATSVTVASSDGFTATYAIGSSTTVHRDRRTVAATSIAVGDVVVVRAAAGTALVVRALSSTTVTGSG